jgi:8-oxo-dGTP pyrophosphatase MutT (NUDIX family)
MALPGGRRDPGDPDLVATALRETSEEVGFPLAREQLVATLDDVNPRTPLLPPIAVRPFVFLLSSRPALVLNPEVAEADWVPLDRLLQAETYRSVALEIGGETRQFPAYQLDHAPVWGLTERILTNLLAPLTS